LLKHIEFAKINCIIIEKNLSCLFNERDFTKTDFIYCLVKLNEKQFASGNEDSSIKLWDLTRGVCFKILAGHVGAVYCLAKNKQKSNSKWEF
jgi:WD40 repeat protein